MKNEFETKLIKEEDQNVPQNVFLSKIKFKESLQEIESYYTKNKKDIDLIKPDSDKNLPLQIAVTAKHYEVVNFIIKNFSNKSKDINLVNSLGWSALHSSCILSLTQDITTLLINNGADINLENKNKQTPLHLACGKNRVENVKVLLSYPEVEINCKDYNGFTPLIKSCASVAYDCAKELLNQNNIKINEQDKQGNTALHYVFEDNKFDIGIQLIQRGANESIKNKDNKTCLDMISDEASRNMMISYLNKKKEEETK